MDKQPNNEQTLLLYLDDIFLHNKSYSTDDDLLYL